MPSPQELMEPSAPAPEVSRVLALAPQDIEVTPFGTKSFFWPVARAEAYAVRDRFEGELLADLRAGLDAQNDDWVIVRILMYEIAREVISGWQLDALDRRTREAGYSLQVPRAHYETLAALVGRCPMPVPRVVRDLERGTPAPPRWRMPLRAVRHLVFTDDLPRKRARKLDPEDIVVLAASDFVLNHASRIRRAGDRPVVVSAFWEWFHVGSSDVSKARAMAPMRAEVVDAVVNAARTAFAAGAATLPDAVEQSLRAWIGDSSRWVRFYLERLRARPHSVPRTFWYGSVNNVWARMMRAAVKDVGGYNVGHDHGRGIGMCPNEGEHGPVFDLCDEFVSYSPALRDALEEIRPEIANRLPSRTAPVFSAPPPGCLAPPRLMALEEASQPYAMYIAPLYLGERVAGLNCLPPDPVWVDWQCRLLTKLAEAGPTVFKAHPDNCLPASDQLLKLTGARLMTLRIEESHQHASVFVTDFLSSPFKTIIRTDRPIVVVDHGLGRMSAGIRSVLERRCAIVPGGFSPDNRLDVDWNAFSEALRVADGRRHDRSCARELLGYPE